MDHAPAQPDWIDAHCHLTDPRIAPALQDTLARCGRAGILRFVLGGIEPAEWERQRELSRRYPGQIVKVFGLHPWWVHDAPDRASIDRGLEALNAAAGECAGIGETGLDAARDRFKRSRESQLAAFEAQLEIAGRHRKPLVLHVVRAHSLALETLARHRAELLSGGLVHSFSGTWADARGYLDLGLTLSISARLTHPQARELHEIVLNAPPDRLVFETDAPDQPPYGAPEALHTPLSLLKVVEKASEIRNESPRALLDRSRDNLSRIFRF